MRDGCIKIRRDKEKSNGRKLNYNKVQTRQKMDSVEDRRRYFIVGSAILEIGLPVFRKRIKDDFTSRGFGSFQDFISNQPVMHILFHLRHTNVWCCQDRPNCNNQSILPLNYHQWGLLFTKANPPNHPRLCHCNYIANPATLKDLDITLASLILLSCCKLTPWEYTAVEEIRNCKNNYLSHNTDCSITEDEFDTLWTKLTTHVLQLDSGKQDELVRIQNRPLDETLCKQYTASLLEIHKKLEEMEASMNAKLEVILRNTQFLCSKAESVLPGARQTPHRMQYKLGQDIFNLNQQIDLCSAPYNVQIKLLMGGVMMDNGTVVLCDRNMKRLVICNTDKSLVYNIPLQYKPWDVTAVNNNIVAVTFPFAQCIQMYDIHNKKQTKTIQVPRRCFTIAYLHNKFIVGCYFEILIIDDQTTKVVQTIHHGGTPFSLHATADIIYYANFPNANLHCVCYTGEKVFTHTLHVPSLPSGITTLQDGSVYVVMNNGQVQHMSSDGQNCVTVTTVGLQSEKGLNMLNTIGYSPKQRKLFTCSGGQIKIFNEV